MKRHINVLYGVVLVLLVLQILTFVLVSTQFSKITARQGSMESDLDTYVTDLRSDIDNVKTESQTNINIVTL